MESFLACLNELIESAEDISTAELIGALEIIKQQILLDAFADDTDDETAE